MTTRTSTLRVVTIERLQLTNNAFVYTVHHSIVLHWCKSKSHWYRRNSMDNLRIPCHCYSWLQGSKCWLRLKNNSKSRDLYDSHSTWLIATTCAFVAISVCRACIAIALAYGHFTRASGAWRARLRLYYWYWLYKRSWSRLNDTTASVDTLIAWRTGRITRLAAKLENWSNEGLVMS